MYDRNKYKRIFIIKPNADGINGSCTIEINNSGGKMTVVAAGLGEGEYSVYFDNEKISDITVNGSGRAFKKISFNPDNINQRPLEVFSSVIISDGSGLKAKAFIEPDLKIKAEYELKTSVVPEGKVFDEALPESYENTIENIIIEDNIMDNTDYEPVTDEVNESMPAGDTPTEYNEGPEDMDINESQPTEKIQYGFSSDFSTIVKRFKEQMERLEAAGVIAPKAARETEVAEKVKAGDEFLPFGENERGWRRICSDMLWTLPLTDIKFPGNQFCINGQRRYKHLILKEFSDRYRVGVPDIYNEKNISQASNLGFYSFMPRTGGRAEKGSAGYWLADILKNN